MTPEDPIAATLAQLKPIEELAPVSSWPPAAGWWVLAAGILLLLIFGTPKLLNIIKQRRYRKQTLDLLISIETQFQKHQNTRQALNDVMSLMKRIAIGLYGREQAAALTGSAWIEFLDNALPQPCFGRQVPEELLTLRYQNNPQQADVKHLIKLSRHWIEQLDFKTLQPKHDNKYDKNVEVNHAEL